MFKSIKVVSACWPATFIGRECTAIRNVEDPMVRLELVGEIMVESRALESQHGMKRNSTAKPSQPLRAGQGSAAKGKLGWMHREILCQKIAQPAGES